jgi:hypothetical protein
MTGTIPTPAQCWVAAQRLALGDSVALAAGVARCEVGQLHILNDLDPEFRALVEDARRLILMPEKDWQARVRAELRFATERALAEEKVSFVNLATRLMGALEPAQDERDEINNHEVYKFFNLLTLEQFAEYKAVGELDKEFGEARKAWAAKAAAVRAARGEEPEIPVLGPDAPGNAERNLPVVPQKPAAAPAAAEEPDEAPMDEMKALLTGLCPPDGTPPADAASPDLAPEPAMTPPAPPAADPWPFEPAPDPVADARKPRPAPAGRATLPVTPLAAHPLVADLGLAAAALARRPDLVPPAARTAWASYPAQGP